MTHRKWTIAAVLLVSAMTTMAQVKTGIEVLRERNFDILQGKRVGLCTNPTGVDHNLVSTIDILNVIHHHIYLVHHLLVRLTGLAV